MGHGILLTVESTCRSDPAFSSYHPSRTAGAGAGDYRQCEGYRQHEGSFPGVPV